MKGKRRGLDLPNQIEDIPEDFLLVVFHGSSKRS